MTKPNHMRSHLHGVAMVFLATIACGRNSTIPSPAESLRRGDELTQQQQYAAATIQYRQAAEGMPRDGQIRLKLAKAYEQSGRLAQATTEAVRAADLLAHDDE